MRMRSRYWEGDAVYQFIGPTPSLLDRVDSIFYVCVCVCVCVGGGGGGVLEGDYIYYTYDASQILSKTLCRFLLLLTLKTNYIASKIPLKS